MHARLTADVCERPVFACGCCPPLIHMKGHSLRIVGPHMLQIKCSKWIKISDILEVLFQYTGWKNWVC